ncbi:MAG: hypothetical protein JWN76_67 [Chitinophagaceae bacterium]|nr:hypothetical protein [Chitinophagaceae bacterium]
MALPFLFAACTKIESTTIGGGLLPAIDGVTTRDTSLDVITDIFPEKDTFYVSPTQNMALGYISKNNAGGDPLFGGTQANINFQVAPSFTPYFYEVGKDSLQLDSAVLVLGYQGAWGDTTSKLGVKIFEIDPSAKFRSDSLYTNVSAFATGNLIGSRSNIDVTTLNDSVHLFRENSINQFRIPLTTAFGNKLLKTYDTTNAFKSDSLFHTVFRGFAVQADPTSNVLTIINLSDTNTKVALYYRYTKRDGGKDTTMRFFRLSSSSAASNFIKRDRTGTEITTYLTSNTSQDSILHLQSAPGTYARIAIPGLSGLSNRIVHRAELHMEQVPDTKFNSDKFFTPPALFLTPFSSDSARRFFFSRDVTISSTGITNFGAFGGIPAFKTDANNNRVAEYNFNITSYVQGIVTGHDKNYNLILFAPYTDYEYAAEKTTVALPISSQVVNSPGIGRVRLGGGNHSQHCMKLHIIYSVLK